MVSHCGRTPQEERSKQDTAKRIQQEEDSQKNTARRIQQEEHSKKNTKSSSLGSTYGIIFYCFEVVFTWLLPPWSTDDHLDFAIEKVMIFLRFSDVF